MSQGSETEGGVANPAPRWVSLVPSITETLFALGAGDEVVGATKFCVRPKDAMGHVQRIGGTKDPKIDKILGLRPTRVFANQEENRREDVERLREAGVDVHLSFPRAVEDVGPMISSLAEAVGRPQEGLVWAERLAAAVSAVCPGPDSGPPVTFLVLIWRGPWMAAAADTFLSSLLEAAGGSNSVTSADSGRYPEVSFEQMAAWDPDLVLLPSEPYPFRGDHIDELVRGTRIERSRFVLCDGELLTWHGARTADGLLAARRWITNAVK